MKSLFDSIYQFQYVLFFIRWTLTLSLVLCAYRVFQCVFLAGQRVSTWFS